MGKPPALQAIQPRLKMVVRGQTEKANRDILERHVLKWKELQKPLRAMDEADKRVRGWDFRGMFEDVLLAEIGGQQRRQGRIAIGKNRKYIKVAKIIENNGSVVDTKLSDLKRARSFLAEKMAGYQARLLRIDMIIEVAEEWRVKVITDDVIEEADSRIAEEAG